MTPDDERPLVLLVEDDSDSREMYALGLGLFGFRVAQAASGIEALRAFDTERPAIIVTDLTLPDMDGIALCETLRRRPGSGTLPILALTGRSGHADHADATAAGVDTLIVKPCPPDALAEAIHRALAPPGA